MDEDQVELTRLAVQFLSNCILKILILNIKYIEKPKNSSKKIFKQQLLKNGTADFFAFTIIFQENTSSLCRNCLLRGAFLKKGTMLIGRSVLSPDTDNKDDQVTVTIPEQLGNNHTTKIKHEKT